MFLGRNAPRKPERSGLEDPHSQLKGATSRYAVRARQRHAVPRSGAVRTRSDPRGFISYAHEDIALFREPRKHLRATEQALGVRFWDDEAIHSGQHWHLEIQRRIDVAKVFLLLVSHNYFDSAFIRDHEFPAIEERLAAPGTLAITVILMPCGWKDVLGRTQAVPTFNGRDQPIDRWQPPHDGYDRAREQIAIALKQFFGLEPRTRGVANPFDALGQDAAGITWVKQGDQFARDSGGAISDEKAAGEPTVAQLHHEVDRLAARFAQTAVRLSNAPGWSGISGDARRLADAVRVAPESVPSRLAGIYATFLSVASFLDLDRHLREGGDDTAEPLEPDIARELGSLVNITTIWLRQFPTARALDDALPRRRGIALPRDAAATVIGRARDKSVVSSADADSVRALLDSGEKSSLHAALGVINLLYRVGGLITAEALAGRNDQSLLVRRGRALLDVPGPEIERLVTELPVDVRHAFSRLLARRPIAKSGDNSSDDGTESAPLDRSREHFDEKRDLIASAIGSLVGTTFLNRKRAYYWNAAHDKRLVCVISKRYRGTRRSYWYGYKLRQHAFLIGGKGFLALGCTDLPIAFSIPVFVISSILNKLSATRIRGEVGYWHLEIMEPVPGSFVLAIPNSQPVSLDEYVVQLPTK
jgi:TIR domain